MLLPASEHIVASINDPGAGPSYSVRRLTAALAQRGARAGLQTVLGWRESGADPDACTAVSHTVNRRDFAALPFLADACFSRDLYRRLKAAAAETDILHAHGLWLMPNVYPAWAVQAGRARFVISPRGMLGPEALAFSRRKKWLFWRLFQRDALRHAACIHATSEAELDEVRAVGLTNPVAVVANGVDLPEPGAELGSGGPRTVFSLGRIHPKKGLDRLVHAWAQVEAESPEWRLRIVGPSELAHDRELMALAASLELKRISIEGPLFGPDKLAAYREAALFVLPSHNENFAMTVAEALAAGLPVISTKGAPWAGLDGEGCGWWVDHGPEPLAAALRAAVAMPPETLRAMGARGRAWMARDFSWDRVARDMLDVYRWVAGGGEQPSSVRLD